MGKKKKKSWYKRQLKPLVKSNQLLLAAIGGAVAGISLTKIMGTEKAQQIVDSVENSIKDFTDKVTRAAAPDNHPVKRPQVAK